MFRYTDLEYTDTQLNVGDLMVDFEYYFFTFNMIYRGYFIQLDDNAIFFHSGDIYFSNHPPLQFDEMALLLSELTGIAEVAPKDRKPCPRSYL